MFLAINPMKSSPVILALLASAAPALNGQSLSTTNQVAASIEATAYAIKERGANHRIWERVEYENMPSGEVVTNVHRYTELAAPARSRLDCQIYWSDRTTPASVATATVLP